MHGQPAWPSTPAMSRRLQPQQRGRRAASAATAASSSSSAIPPAWSLAARRAHLAVVLVEPQICENIGAAARAMRNFGVAPEQNGGCGPNLRLVKPRDGCPPPQLSFDVACGGVDLVGAAGCYDTLEQALADRHVIYAATARRRGQGPPVLSSRGAFGPDFARRCAAVAAGGAERARVAVVFGRESSGLTNDEVGRAHAVVEVDACGDYPVLNLGAAVGVLAYELWGVRRGEVEALAAGEGEQEGANGRGAGTTRAAVAEARQVDGLLARLYASLERGGFFVERDKRPSTERSLGALLRRVDGLGERDLALLHGVLTALDKQKSNEG